LLHCKMKRPCAVIPQDCCAQSYLTSRKCTPHRRQKYDTSDDRENSASRADETASIAKNTAPITAMPAALPICVVVPYIPAPEPALAGFTGDGIYSVPEISTTGLTEEEARTRGIRYEVGVARFRETSRGHITGLNDGMMKMVFSTTTRRLLSGSYPSLKALEHHHHSKRNSPSNQFRYFRLESQHGTDQRRRHQRPVLKSPTHRICKQA
jgi:pyridine nucleotide-disulfide oxidoreductase